jgi:hypothetical protein
MWAERGCEGEEEKERGEEEETTAALRGSCLLLLRSPFLSPSFFFLRRWGIMSGLLEELSLEGQ